MSEYPSPAELFAPPPAAPSAPAVPDDPESQALALDEALAKWETSRERAIAAVANGRMTPEESADLMLARSRDIERARGRDAGVPEIETGPRPHHDAELASRGFMEPTAPDPYALETQFDLRGEELTPEARTNARALSSVIPPEIAGDVVHLIRDLAEMEDDAHTQEASETQAERRDRERWGRLYDRNMEYLDGLMAMLPRPIAAGWRNGLATHGPARDRIIRFFEEKYLPTAAGQLWYYEASRKRGEALEREHAEAVERERQNDQFGR